MGKDGNEIGRINDLARISAAGRELRKKPVLNPAQRVAKRAQARRKTPTATQGVLMVYHRTRG